MSIATGLGTAAVGAVFGLALAAPPGPMNAVIAEESVSRGWLAGFTAGLGAMTADLVFLALALAGVVAFLDGAPAVRAVMVGVGGLLMLYFAVDAVRTARESFTTEESGSVGESESTAEPGSTAESGSIRDAESLLDPGSVSRVDVAETRGFRRAFALALTNPYQILFWVTVGAGLLEPGTVDVLSYLPGVGDALANLLVVETGSPVLLAGLFAGIAVWIVGFPAMLVGIGRRVDAFTPAVATLSAVVLAGFGAAFLWTAAATLL